MAVKTTGS